MRSRRGFVAGMGALGAGMILSPLSRIFGGEAGLDFNVLLIVCDALRADRLGCYGYERDLGGGKRGSTTPVMDALAARGVLYENCVAQSNWTQTGMAPMLYSAWPVLKGDYHSFDYVRAESRPLEAVAGELKRFGIQANPYLKQRIFTRQFDTYKFVKHKKYAPAKMMNDTIDFEVLPDVQKGKKFLAYVHYMEAHEPYNYPHEFRGRFTDASWKYVHPVEVNHRLLEYNDNTGRRVLEIPAGLQAQLRGTGEAFDEDVMSLDQNLGRLFGWLKEWGVADETVVILAADHGQGFGEHGWCGHKATMYQEEVHVPLIIAGPGAPKGERVKAQVRNVDVMPTLAAMAGRGASGMVGAPLLPVGRVEAAGNRVAYSCSDYSKYGETQRLLKCMVTTERMKYIQVRTQQRELIREELYDLAADPGETKDLAGKRMEETEALSAKMKAFEAAAYWRGRGGGAGVEELDEETKRQLKSLGYIN